MGLKSFWKKSFGGLIIKNILIAAVLILVLIGITFWGINKYTDHGVTELVPDLRGAYVEEAEIILAQQGLYPRVIDSVYQRGERLGTIVEQNPSPYSTMKRNRPVYLVINSMQERKIPLPEISDYSSRQAAAILGAAGINVESITYAPSEYKDLVIDVQYKGESIGTGYEIPDGESVVLVVGRGLGTQETIVPQLKGLTLEEARREIINSSFILGSTFYDNRTDNELPYVVYRQEPADGRVLSSGSRINVWFTTDPELLENNMDGDAGTDEGDEEFF